MKPLAKKSGKFRIRAASDPPAGRAQCRFKIDYYENLFRFIKENFGIHLHALSPPEIVHLSKLSRLSLKDTIARLKDAGLDSIPGGGAEILVDRVRDIISPKNAQRISGWM